MSLFVPDLPPEGAKTLWEDRCTLVSVDDAHDASSAAKLVPSVVLLGPGAASGSGSCGGQLPPELAPQRVAVYPPDASSADGAEETGAGGTSRPTAASSSAPGSLLGRLAAPLLAPLTGPINLLWSTFLSGCQPRAAAPPLAWHPRQPWLAAADSAGRVQVVELPAAAPSGGGGRPAAAAGGGRSEVLVLGAAEGLGGAGGGGGGCCCRAVLAHEAVQPQALSLAWCPTSPGLLAVGSVGGVALWALSAAGEGRPPVAAAGRGSGPWLRHLRTRVPGARVTGLSWSPCGRLLAAASPGQAGLQVWEVASGSPAAVAAGPAAFDCVRWSPCGNYVFAAGTGSRHFYMFETQRWRWARWQTDGGAALSAPTAAAAATASATSPPPPPPASVVAAAWAPALPGRPAVLLAALSAPSATASAGGRATAAGSATAAAAPYLVAVHLVDAPPGLGAQLLPVALPDLQRAAAVAAGAGPAAAAATAGSGGGAAAASAAPVAVAVADMAWDAAGERLAVLLAPAAAGAAAGNMAAQHCVALYGTTTDPLVSCRLLGFARPPAAAAGRRPRVLLEWLSPGRRAAVVAAGVAANALLAAAFVAYQVVSYGELGVVVRPGARVRLAEGYGSAAESAELLAAEAAAEGTAASSLEAAVGERHAASGAEQEAEAAKQWRRLRAGDVVLRVGGTALPAGGDMDAAMVRALEKEALAAVAAAARGRGGAVGACGGAAATLEGVGMAVLRTAAPEAGDEAAASRRGRQEVLQMDAAEVLRYETLVVGPNSAAGYRRPGSATEAAHMLGREYYSWASVVLRSWAEAASAAVSFARGGSSQEAGAPAAAAQAGSSSSSVSGAGGSAQMVGPLGLVASAAAMAVAADRQSRAPSCYSCEQEAAGMAAGGGASGSGVAGATAESGSMSYSEQPPALLDLGIQLNLQLAAVNMLPLPVLDGGQLLLVALEAARGGRRLPAGVERWALVASALLVGGWVAALSLADVVGLADKAAGRLAVALTSSSSPHAAGSQHQRQLQLAVSVGGNSSSSSGGSSSGSGGVQGISRGFAADAAAALDAATGAWAV